MQSLVETSRTRMRPFDFSDAEQAFLWLSDSTVMQYIPFGADSTIEDTIARIGRYIDHQNRHGFSKWVVEDRKTKRLVGDAGFYVMPEDMGIELGYRLARTHWGRGLATEVAGRWIEVASEFSDASTLFAYEHPDNSASFRGMDKLGFQFSRNEIIYGSEEALYELSLNTTNSEQAAAPNPA